MFGTERRTPLFQIDRTLEPRAVIGDFGIPRRDDRLGQLPVSGLQEHFAADDRFLKGVEDPVLLATGAPGARDTTVRGGIGVGELRALAHRGLDRQRRTDRPPTRIIGRIGAPCRAVAGVKAVFPGLVRADGARVALLPVGPVHKVEDLCSLLGRDGEHAAAARRLRGRIGYLRREQPETDPHGGHARVMSLLQLPVIGVPAFVVAAPRDAGKGADAREGHIVEVVGLFGLVRDVGFAPKGPGQPDDMPQLLRGEPGACEVESVDLAGVEDGGPVVSVLTGRLAHVEIEVFAGHDDGRIPLCRGVETRLDALPAVYAALAGEAARAHGLVPDGGTLAVAGEDGGHALHEEVFQLVGIIHAALPHQGLTVGAAFPLRHVDLVAAHVDVLRGEEFADLAQNILQQPVILLTGHAPRRAVVVAVGRDGVGRIVAADLGMQRGDVAAVSREVDFGDDLDVALGGVADQPAHLLLCEVTSVFL